MPNLSTSQWFVLTPAHATLARNLWIVEYHLGGFGTDRIRPFGEQDITDQIARLLQWPLTEKEDEHFVLSLRQDYEANILYKEMALTLQVILHTGVLTPGVYHKEDTTTPDGYHNFVWKEYRLSVDVSNISSVARDIFTLLLDGNENDEEWTAHRIITFVKERFVIPAPEVSFDDAVRELVAAHIIEQLPDGTYSSCFSYEEQSDDETQEHTRFLYKETI